MENEKFNNLEKLKNMINENLKEEKYFSQNIPFSTMNISKLPIIDISQKIKLPSNSELEKLSSKELYKNDNSLEEIILYIRSLLTPFFRNILPSNASSGKIPCTSGGSLSIQGIKKWICSGFTYTYIFEKQGGKNKKNYYLSFVIDLSQTTLLLCNYSHSIATIILLLMAPSTVEDNEEIFIDVIINTIDGVKIVDFNAKCSIFQNINKINEIINIINKDLDFSCCPGSCVYTAYELLLQRRENKKIFLITDGFVSDKYEIELVVSLIQSCENKGIDFVTIGVGSFPNGLKDVYPNCCYSPSIRTLQDSLSTCFIFSKETFSTNIEPNLFYINEDKQTELLNIINEEPKDKILQNSINNEPITLLNMISNENSISLNNTVKMIENPEQEPYKDIFDRFKILVVILYLGNDEHDKDITTKIFEDNAGKSLKKKGFKYEIVYSYGKAINQLLNSESEYCPYDEVWVFCSKGNGSLPEIAEDKDSNKISLFLEILAEYNKNGGALFLFCDNYPFVLEANLLLKEYIKFEEGNINFEMKGSYNNKNPKERYIYEKGSQKNKNGYFKSDHFLESPGKADIRLSLRIGLNKFSEGITLSYAETFDKSENYFPFTPFAYLTDPEKPRPFILYYDPKVGNGKISRGPIVVHGGFTSAFYDFKEDGTGRLVISIACWLIRKEEYYMNLREGIEKKVLKIQQPSLKNIVFDKWIKFEKSEKIYSILILDVSGSMNKHYSNLIAMANRIIINQQNNDENEGVIILFGSFAKAIVNGKYRLLKIEDIGLSKVGGNTNFYNAFQVAKNHIYNKNNFIRKRILFLTDGIADSSLLGPIVNEMKNQNFTLNIVGFGDSQKFEHLRKFASNNGFYTSTNFKDVEIFCQKVFAAE